MGLVIKLNNIISPNAFTVSYKTGPNPYPLDSGFTSYGGTYSAGTTLVVVSGITINFNSSYWFKITDNVTNRYIIENVETNDPIAYMSCCPIPVATAICYHECYPPSNVDADCIGLTPTPTPTPTPVCDVPTDVTAECTTIEPTQTPTPTPTATPTPTPTSTPTILLGPIGGLSSTSSGACSNYMSSRSYYTNVNFMQSGVTYIYDSISPTLVPVDTGGQWKPFAFGGINIYAVITNSSGMVTNYTSC